MALFFEKLNVPALFVGRSSVSSAFSVGKHTGLVVDLGFGGVRIGPVYDGYLVKSGVLFEAALGGDHLTGETRLLISKSENELHIPQEIASKQSVGLGESAVFTKVPNFKVKESFLKYHRTIILEDLKEAIIQVSETSPFNERDLAVRPLRYYEMPDGFCKGFGVDRFRLGELLFDPNFESSVPSSSIDVSFDEISNDPVEDASNIQSATNASVNTKDSKAIDGLIPLILKSIAACDVEIRSSLLSNVLLTGGGSQIGGLVERVAFELAKVPAIGRIRVQAAGSTTVERRFASWIGASILASLGSFSQLWLTRAEYKEHGASYIDRKCP